MPRLVRARPRAQGRGRAEAPAGGPAAKPKRISLLGSTGSIGTQTLDICREYPGEFEVVALAAGSNVELLAEQAREFRPQLVALQDASRAPELAEALSGMGRDAPEIMTGEEGAVGGEGAGEEEGGGHIHYYHSLFYCELT